MMIVSIIIATPDPESKKAMDWQQEQFPHEGQLGVDNRGSCHHLQP